MNTRYESFPGGQDVHNDTVALAVEKAYQLGVQDRAAHQRQLMGQGTVSIMQSWNEIFDNRCDEIGLILSQDEECAKLFNSVIETQEALREKLSNGDSELLDLLEEVYATLTGLVERKYYLAGLQDGADIKRLLISEGDVQHVAS